MIGIVKTSYYQPDFMKFKKTFITLSFAVLGSVCVNQSQALENFTQAKRALYAFYKALPQPETFYCRCPLRRDREDRFYPVTNQCANGQFSFPQNEDRAYRMEVEHIMPAWEFGHQLQCWQEGGRERCQEISPAFNEMEGDLWDLVYANGAVNKARSYYRFREWNSRKGTFGGCPITVDSHFKQVEPPEYTRGLIARTYLYLSEKYRISLANSQKRMFEVWNRKYQPDKFECLRAAFIEQVQGDSNPYLDGRCNF